MGVIYALYAVPVAYICIWSLRRTNRREREVRQRRCRKAVARLEFDLDVLLAEDPFYRWPEDPQFR